MGTYVERNWLQPGEVVEPLLASTTVPAACLKLATATELLYHEMPAHEIRNCFTKDIVKYGQPDHKFVFFERKIKEHVSSVSRATIDRGFGLACFIIGEAMKNAAFYDTMRKDSKIQRVMAINKFITLHQMFYLFRDQFKAVSFRFIFHQGVRPILAEEKIRKCLQNLICWTACRMIYDYLKHYIRAEEGKEDAPITRIGAGRVAVGANYRAIPYHCGHVGNVGESLRRLPASPDFEGTARRQAGLGDKSGGNGVSGGKRKKGTDGEEKEDDCGIVGKRQRVGDE